MARTEATRAKRTVSGAAAGLQDLIDSADELLSNLRDQQGEAVDALRDRVSATAASARRRLQRLGPQVQDAAGETLDSAVGFLRRDPWRAVAIGALTVLAFSLFTRLGSDD